jgi:PAS domain-containing protein
MKAISTYLLRSREGFYEAHYSPFRDHKNEIIGGLGIVRDITQRKRVEAEHEELLSQQIARTQLEVAERHFRSLFDQSPLSMQILSPDGRTLRVNKALGKVVGPHPGKPGQLQHT